MTDLLAALCLVLVLVLEGLFLFVAPNVWKQAMAQLQALSPRGLRNAGGIMVIAGLLALYGIRGG